MSNADHVAPLAGPAAASMATAKARTYPAKSWGLLAGAAALVAIILMPQPAGLSVAGQHMLAIFAFAVIVWMTEAMDYAASSVILMALIAFLLGMAPDPAHPGHLIGTHVALSAALAGFTNSAVALIAASLVIAAGMSITGLDRRVAFKVISVIGTSPAGILAGIIIVMAILAFFIPTASARVACLVPILLGMISALGIDKKSRTAGMLMMSIVYLSLIWAMGIATGAAQNVYVNALMERTIHVSISWIDWLIVGAPLSVALSIALYVVLMKMMAPGKASGAPIEGADTLPEHPALRLGPMTPDETRLLVFSVILLGFWATQGKLHSFDSSSVAVVAVAIMFIPKIGMLDWKQVQPRIPWGILIQLGVGVGLGTALLKTGAAAWLATFVVIEFGVQQMSVFAILAVLWLFLIVVHLGFSSGAAMATTMIPVLISVLQEAQIATPKVAGMTMLLAFATSIGWILPINGPQNMLAFGTGTFEARDFIRVGIVMTVVAYGLLLLFAATWWHWLGYV
jgi:solute carrier family 13 (sodium-dependent dicarboxylate transporter), member 2/3/5